MANAPVRARRPDTRQAPHGHAINCAPVHHYLFLAGDFAHAQNHLPEMHAGRPGKCEKEGLWGVSGAGIRAIHLAA